jgi:hypothetical protein
MEWRMTGSVNPMTFAVLLTSYLLMSDAPTIRPSVQPVPQHASPKEIATHATKGVVKAVSTTTLVVTTRMAGKRSDTTFVLTPSTQKEGALAAGSTVEIRYRTEGKQRIATAVSVEASPQ